MRSFAGRDVAQQAHASLYGIWRFVHLVYGADEDVVPALVEEQHGIEQSTLETERTVYIGHVISLYLMQQGYLRAYGIEGRLYECRGVEQVLAQGEDLSGKLLGVAHASQSGGRDDGFGTYIVLQAHLGGSHPHLDDMAHATAQPRVVDEAFVVGFDSRQVVFPLGIAAGYDAGMTFYVTGRVCGHVAENKRDVSFPPNPKALLRTWRTGLPSL